MRQSVSAIFCHGDEIFIIERNEKLSVFPGYLSFPGGKVDENDRQKAEDFDSRFESGLMSALVREMKEELGIDLNNLKKSGLVSKVSFLGIAITPDFNPYRFENYYYKIDLSQRVPFVVDEHEAARFCWIKARDLLIRYENADVIAVPPMVKLLKALGRDPFHETQLDLSLDFNSELEVPMIESIFGVKQFMPLSHTFPPANRTNCFLIGDEGAKPTLIDPSPRDKEEYQKLIYSLRNYQIEQILITHHHPDHHEQAGALAQKFNIPLLMSRDTWERTLEKHGADYFGACAVHFLKEGDVLCHSRGQEVTIYEVPGHDEGQLALAPKDMKWFLVGDLIQTIGTVVIGHPEGDMGKYFKSLERVIELAPKFIIPSHGIALGGTYKIWRTLEHRRQREKQIHKLFGQGKNNLEILGTIYEGLAPELNQYALKTIDAHLRKLASEGHCDYESE